MGFFRSLTDLSFRSFVTVQLVRFAYMLALTLIPVASLIVMALAGNAAFDASQEMSALSGTGASLFELQAVSERRQMSVLLAISAPFAGALGVVLARVWCEMIVVVFSVAEGIGETTEGRQPSEPAYETGGQ